MDYSGLERYSNPRNFGCRVSDQYSLKGWKLLILENELLRVSVLIDKGSDIFEFLYKPLDVDFMWHSPMGLCDRALYVQSVSPTQGSFMDFYEGGWQEIAPSGGEGCVYKDASYGLHGEVWNLPWDCVIEHDDPGEVSARLTCRLLKVPLVIRKKLSLRSREAVLHIDETISNESEEPIDFMWGHHPAFGAPFLNDHCVVDIPAARIAVHSFSQDPKKRFAAGNVFDWPNMTTVSGETVDGSRILPASARTSDELCFLDLSEGWYALTDTERQVGFAMEWDLAMFPYVWFWQVFGGGDGYPWYGRNMTCALEPWSSYPLFGIQRSIEHGSHKELGPGESASTWLKAAAFSGASRVAKVEQGKVIPV